MMQIPKARLLPGVVSVTFRQKTVDEVIGICVRNQLKAVEWGGDVHCPPHDLALVRQVAKKTTDADLGICAYGSYYRAGVSPPDEFLATMEAASILGAPLIRIWAGNQASVHRDKEYRLRVEADLARISELAGKRGLRISLEYHSQTLTDDADSTARLLRLIPRLLVQWQPPNGMAAEPALDTLRRLGDSVSNLHVFSWSMEQESLVRLPLEAHTNRWQKYLAAAATLPGSRYALIEFVRNDSEEQFAEDAATLHRWLGTNE